MQMISEVMTRDVRFVTPQENVQRAAQMMDELNVGALPVCDGNRLVGMVTDRDITVRATAAGLAPRDAQVDEVMSTDVRWCFEDQSLDEVMQQMADTQIRRVPVVSHDEAHTLIGIVSLGDLATKTPGDAQKRSVEQTVEKVSSPSEPDRSPAGAARAADIRGGVSSRTGSDTGTATGFAGTDALGAVRGSTASGEDAVRDTGAPDGTDATGVSGASGGTAGTAGSGGTAGGASP